MSRTYYFSDWAWIFTYLISVFQPFDFKMVYTLCKRFLYQSLRKESLKNLRSCISGIKIPKINGMVMTVMMTIVKSYFQIMVDQ